MTPSFFLFRKAKHPQKLRKKKKKKKKPGVAEKWKMDDSDLFSKKVDADRNRPLAVKMQKHNFQSQQLKIEF